MSSSVALDQCFSIYSDGNLVPHDDPALVHRALPAHAKVVPVDGRGRDKASTLQGAFVDTIFPERRWPLTEVADIKGGLTSHTAKRVSRAEQNQTTVAEKH